MSKASEWAERWGDVDRRATAIRQSVGEPLKFAIQVYPGPPPVMRVLGEVAWSGHLLVSGNNVKPETAIAFARWILDTFGEGT